MRFILAWLVLSLVVPVTVALMPGIEVEWSLGFYWLAGWVLAGVNVLYAFVMRLLSVRLLVGRWGLPCLVLNAVALLGAERLVDSLRIESVVSALVAAVPITVVAFLDEALISDFESTLSGQR